MKKIIYTCDLCGKESTQSYTKCPICGKDICVDCSVSSCFATKDDFPDFFCKKCWIVKGEFLDQIKKLEIKFDKEYSEICNFWKRESERIS